MDKSISSEKGKRTRLKKKIASSSWPGTRTSSASVRGNSVKGVSLSKRTADLRMRQLKLELFNIGAEVQQANEQLSLVNMGLFELNKEKVKQQSGKEVVSYSSDLLPPRKFEEKAAEKLAEKMDALRRANSSLERSNQNLEQFAYVASHDLQEPLRKIRIFAAHLQERYTGLLNDETRTYLQKIQHTATRMSVLVKDLLNYSRLSDTGNTFSSTDLNTILQEVLGDFELLIAEKNAGVKFSQLPVIEALPFQMRQLFYNLIGNALKFSFPERRPEISISSFVLKDTTHHEDLNPGLSYCELIFSDNGIGFNQQFSEQIFVIFQRLNNSSRYPGSGIGLALCRKIILNHRGKIFARSKENEGTSFHIILPCKQSV